MATLTCPECGEQSERDTVTRTADCFCLSCDFPLFWAPAARALAPGNERETDDALRRLPGVAGHRARATRACPACGEHNPTNGETCLRCDAPLELPPPPPPVELPPAAPAVAPPPPQPPARRPRWFWPVLVVSLVAVTVAVLLQAL